MTVEAEPDWAGMGLEPVPEMCQQFGCCAQVQTWCPLCRAFFCDEHDQLTPVRRHDCLGGSAEEEA
jgi:hypothetical protein